MEHIARVLTAIEDGHARSLSDVCAQTRCRPEDLEAMIRRGFVRPLRGRMLCITPRGVERQLRDRSHVTPAQVARAASFD